MVPLFEMDLSWLYGQVSPLWHTPIMKYLKVCLWLFSALFLILGQNEFWVISIQGFDYGIKHPLTMQQNLFDSRNQHSNLMYFGIDTVLSISLLLYISSLSFAFMLSLPLASVLVVHWCILLHCMLSHPP